nr:MAG TPA: hypothetical protein [Caudoviricetes sp.]
MPTTSLILFAVAIVASSGDCSIFRYVSREIPSFSAISRCVNPAYWRACLTVNPKFQTSFRFGLRILYSTFSRMSRT